MSVSFDLVVAEGWLDQVTARRLLEDNRLTSAVTKFLDKRGGGSFWADAPRYNSAAKQLRVFALADLESADCAPGLIQAKLPHGCAAGMTLRIAVRMVESWWLADRPVMASFLGVPEALIPRRPDELLHAKRELVALARRSRHRRMREGLVPSEDIGGLVGEQYAELMSAFVKDYWRPEWARLSSPSLDRTLRAVERLSS